MLLTSLIVKLCVAEPFISEIKFEPGDRIWNGTTNRIYVNCTNVTENASVYASVKFPGGHIDHLDFSKIPTGYFLTPIGEPFTNSPGELEINITCEDNNQSTTNSTNFYISTFTNSIKLVNSPIYANTPIMLYLAPQVDGSIISSSENLDISIKINDVTQATYPIWYESLHGWVLKTINGTNTGTKKITVVTNVSLEGYPPLTDIKEWYEEIKPRLDFDIVSHSSTDVHPGDNFTLGIRATEMGNDITSSITGQCLSYQIDSTLINKENIVTTSGNPFQIKITMPDKDPGKHTLKIILSYNGYTANKIIPINYVITASGKIVDINGKGVSGIRIFLNNALKFTTSTDGTYSGNILPGIYDMKIELPHSTLYLNDVDIESFNDPIKYYYLTTDVFGIKSYGLFIYDVSLPFSNARIIMNYDWTKVPDEKELRVYKCDEWNPVKKVCNSEWEEQTAEIKSGTATVETASLSAYVIGIRKVLSVNFGLDKDVYNLNSPVKIDGIVEEGTTPIDNATVKIFLNGNLVSSTQSNNGVFRVEFLAPDKEGNYTLLVTAEKQPYMICNNTRILVVKKSKEIALMIPDPVRVKQGENKTVNFLIINVGQSDVSNISVSLDGLPTDYYRILEFPKTLKVGDNMTIPIRFVIPVNASENTFSATFRVNSNEVSKEQIFGFTIEKSIPKENITYTTNVPTANVILPSYTDIIYVSSFGFAAISGAYTLKKIKKRKLRRREIKNLLLDVKREIRKGKTTELPVLKTETIQNKKIKNKELLTLKNIISKKKSKTTEELKEKSVEERIEEGLKYLF